MRGSQADRRGSAARSYLAAAVGALLSQQKAESRNETRARQAKERVRLGGADRCRSRSRRDGGTSSEAERCGRSMALTGRTGFSHNVGWL
jgi:hypothetical protein